MQTKTIALVIIGVLLVVGGVVIAYEGMWVRGNAAVFRMEYNPRALYDGYTFILTENAEISLEDNVNIWKSRGSIFSMSNAPVPENTEQLLLWASNTFFSPKLEYIKEAVEPEFILAIEPRRVPQFQPLPEPIFVILEDISEDDWIYPFVTHGFRFGLLERGRGRSFYFEPERSITLAEFITMIGRLHEYGNETIRTPGRSTNDERYLHWVAELGITGGRLRGNLTPDTILNRAQAAVILHQYMEALELGEYFKYIRSLMGQGFTDTSRFTWAGESIERLRQYRLTVVGADHNSWSFRPQDDITRAEALEMLVRLGSAVFDGVILADNNSI